MLFWQWSSSRSDSCKTLSRRLSSPSIGSHMILPEIVAYLARATRNGYLTGWYRALLPSLPGGPVIGLIERQRWTMQDVWERFSNNGRRRVIGDTEKGVRSYRKVFARQRRGAIEKSGSETVVGKWLRWDSTVSLCTVDIGSYYRS